MVCLGLALHPLGAGTRWRAAGLAIDVALAAVTLVACGYVVVEYERIMTSLPWATTLDMALTVGLVVTVLELGRRTVGIIFPVLVLAGLGYALLGDRLPGALGHRGFDAAFVTETIFLGDLGIWGMLTGIAATVIAAFVLFGALLLHSGGGQAFMDLAMRLGGRQPGGAAKIATIASGLFGMVSGSAVANVATTGNFTIPMMIRLGYPRPFAAAVEAVASTGGQIAPPIMGAAAFVMAEILGLPYLTILLGAIVPAALFYLSVFATVHFVAVRRGLALVPDEELPAWAHILAPRRVAPVLAALGGLGVGIWLGRSIATSAFYGIAALLVAFVVTQVGTLSPREMATRILEGFVDAGRGLVIIGVLLAGAQVLVSMINLTGIGVTLSSLIVTLAGGLDGAGRADRRARVPRHGHGAADDGRLRARRRGAGAGDDRGRHRPAVRASLRLLLRDDLGHHAAGVRGGVRRRRRRAHELGAGGRRGGAARGGDLRGAVHVPALPGHDAARRFRGRRRGGAVGARAGGRDPGAAGRGAADGAPGGGRRGPRARRRARAVAAAARRPRGDRAARRCALRRTRGARRRSREAPRRRRASGPRMRTLRIGAGAGFSGDRIEPAVELAERGGLDYLVFECLAERTIALAQQRRRHDPSAGFDPLLERRMSAVLGACVANGTRVVTNMGAANPVAAARCVADVARRLGLAGLRIAAVTGDDVLDAVVEGGFRLDETGQPAAALGEAHDLGERLPPASPRSSRRWPRARTSSSRGRAADPALFLAPQVHELGWAADDWQRLGRGTLVGHLLECAGQVTGGYFADPGMNEVPDLARLGFPLAEIDSDGNATITKLPGTGGRVTRATCTEQLLYEIHDPARYLQPDVAADFSGVTLVDDGPDRVRVAGGRGRPRTGRLKVSVGYVDGWTGEGQISYAGPGAEARGRLALDVVRARLEAVGPALGETRAELIGVDSAGFGTGEGAGAAPPARGPGALRRPVRVARGRDEGRRRGGEPVPERPGRRRRRHRLRSRGRRDRVDLDSRGPDGARDRDAGELTRMILRDIAHGRAGDKGDTSNVSVIARTPELWPLVEREVTAARVAAFLGSGVGGEVTRYELAQLHALNFVLRGALAGGVTRSLALDAHGKCLATVLLGMELDTDRPADVR